MIKLWFSLVAVSGLLTVALGAFGAHGLKGRISEHLLSAFQTGTHYQMFHTLALFGLVILLSHLVSAPKILWLAAYFWLAGMLFFSGSLYWLAVGGPSWLGPVTPIGGLLLMLGWLCLAIGSWQLQL